MCIRDSGNTGTNEADFINSTGMSWFPGYAVDVETGKRLNIFFGENRFFDENFATAAGDPSLNVGNDMLYNPTDRLILTPGFFDLLQDPFGAMANIFAGGQHFIYVSSQEYDGCQELRENYTEANTLDQFFAKRDMLSSVTWCSMSMMQPGESILSYEEGVVPAEMTFKLRVDRAYNVETTFNLRSATNSCFIEDPTLPVYEFEISGKTIQDLATEDVGGALDQIRAVPNPYYAFSEYENSQADNFIKITNVPSEARVTIYSLDGKFIKEFNRDELVSNNPGTNPGVIQNQVNPSILWDLKNAAGIPVASGVYLIHVAAPGLGEKTIKWFGVARQFDPSGF